MKYLLDTHALLWAWTEPERLSSTSRTIIGDAGELLVASAASALEVATKHRIGKLPGAEALLSRWEKNLVDLGVEALPVSHAAALLAGSLDWEHRDPFDRLLVAQAILGPFEIITRDADITGNPAVRCVW